MCSSFWFSRWHSITLSSSEVMQLSLLCLRGGGDHAHQKWGILANFEHKCWPQDREVWTMQKKCWSQGSGSLNNAKMTKATRVLNGRYIQGSLLLDSQSVRGSERTPVGKLNKRSFRPLIDHLQRPVTWPPACSFQLSTFLWNMLMEYFKLCPSNWKLTLNLKHTLQ